MFLHMMGSLKTVPPRMLRMVPFGDFHIFFNLNSVHNQGRHTDTHTTIRRALPKNSTITLSLSFTNPSLPDCTSPHQSLSPSPPLPPSPITLSLFPHQSLSLPPSLPPSPITLSSSGVMVAHLTPTLYFRMASAHSTVTAHTHTCTRLCVSVLWREKNWK